MLFSAHRHWLWEFARLGYYRGVWSAFIVGELVRIRVEHSIRLGVARATYRERINNLIHRLSDVLMLVNHRHAQVGGVLSDPGDEPVLATALVAGAGFVVSLNTHDFPAGGAVLGARFVTPADFLAQIAATRADFTITGQVQRIERLLP